METKTENRTRDVKMRLTPSEYGVIETKWKASTCRNLSDYLRHSLFEKPIVTTYRNRSLDDFMEEMIRLRSELNATRDNFNQMVKRLHPFSRMDEIKSWLLACEVEKNTLSNKIDEIKDRIGKISESWLQ